MGGEGLTGPLAISGTLVIPVVLAVAFVLGWFDGLNLVAAPVYGGAAVGGGFGRLGGGPLGGLLVGAFGASAALLPAAGVLAIATIVVVTLPAVASSASAV